VTTIFGWDMSVWDDPGIGNAIDQGIAFVTHKAGGDRDDPELAAWWTGVRGHRDQLLLGAYWVLYPGSPVARADAFLARLDDQCPGWRDGPFLLQVDCERWNNDPSTVPSAAEIDAFCDRLVAEMPRLRPIVYAPQWVYGSSLRSVPYPFWASSYVGSAGGFRQLYPGDSSARWGAYSGQVPAILQYSSSAVIGGQSTSDADAFRGTLAQLTALVAPGWSDIMTPDDKAWLAAQFAALTDSDATPLPDGTPTSAVGRRAWGQGVPNGTRGLDSANAPHHVRTTAWEAIEDLGAKLVELEQKVAAVGTPDPAVLAQAIANAIPADLAGKVADVLAQRLAS
jgi:hypothetical protein